MPLAITVIAEGKAYERELKSRRVQLDGELIIVGGKQGIEDTLARLFALTEELRREVESQ